MRNATDLMFSKDTALTCASIFRAGKIPAAMLRSYKRKCEQFEGKIPVQVIYVTLRSDIYRRRSIFYIYFLQIFQTMINHVIIFNSSPTAWKNFQTCWLTWQRGLTPLKVYTQRQLFNKVRDGDIVFVFLGCIDLRPWLSSVSRKLKLIFGPRPQESATETIDLDVVALNMDSDSMQVSFVSNLFDMGIERM